ncbi:hypothetical protein SAMN05192555_105110 [Franzmannia pantelleriensis]|uniref:Uncharacterized protein n=1 Tax=Franzmannia pantelleriensis TaxID=48727 RepID=A0A1G9L0I0_9GAMM|nr:hypothetical protein [Halomonas pantelleriensis]SDL55462.1 hypothetical protein SAMN05192555_105110 [Halomonas pantelleriensis]
MNDISDWITNSEQAAWAVNYLKNKNFKVNQSKYDSRADLEELFRLHDGRDDFMFAVSKMKSAWRKRSYDAKVKRENRTRCQFNLKKSTKSKIFSTSKQLGYKNQHEYIEALVNQDKEHRRQGNENLNMKLKQEKEKVEHLERQLLDYQKSATSVVTTCYLEIEKLIKEKLELKEDINKSPPPDHPHEGLSLDKIHKINRQTEEIKMTIQKKMQVPSSLHMPLLCDKVWKQDP